MLIVRKDILEEVMRFRHGVGSISFYINGRKRRNTRQSKSRSKVKEMASPARTQCFCKAPCKRLSEQPPHKWGASVKK